MRAVVPGPFFFRTSFLLCFHFLFFPIFQPTMAQPSRCRPCVPTAFVHFEVQCQYATIQFLLACLYISGFLKRGCSSSLGSYSRYGGFLFHAQERFTLQHRHDRCLSAGAPNGAPARRKGCHTRQPLDSLFRICGMATAISRRAGPYPFLISLEGRPTMNMAP